MNIISAINLFYKRKIEPGFKIDKNSLVIDIGSGDKPFWRADVFLDKLSLGNNQRTSNTSTIHNLGKFVDSRVEKMPFKDKTFDFSFCSHLLEHVEDPGKVIGEIERISKKGYIEVPNGIVETIMPFGSHLWFVFYDGNDLIFVRKDRQMHKILTDNGKVHEYMLVKIKEPFIRIYWNKKIKFRIIDNLSEKDKYVSPVDKTTVKKRSFSYYILLVKVLRMFFYKNKKEIYIRKT